MAKKSNLRVVALAAVPAVLVIVVLLVYLLRPHPQCAFSGWKRTIGVDLETQVKSLDALKGKLGITDSQVRDYDRLMQDFALKYDAACQDSQAGRMTNAEYTCRRANMDRVLDELRRFSQAVEAAKSLTDPEAQRQVVSSALTALQAASSAGYSSGCASAIDVNPQKLSFLGLVPERSFQITNRGNNDVRYSVDGLPEAFDPKPNSGTLLPGATASVAILRTMLPPPSGQPVRFHVRTNLQDDREVEIAMDAENIALWQRLGDKAAKMTPAGEPTVDTAARVISEALANSHEQSVSPAYHYALASDLLLARGARDQAKVALHKAVAIDPSFSARLNRPVPR
jgi:tetratricopeptide (TPR) repeat protein